MAKSMREDPYLLSFGHTAKRPNNFLSNAQKKALRLLLWVSLNLHSDQKNRLDTSLDALTLDKQLDKHLYLDLIFWEIFTFGTDRLADVLFGLAFHDAVALLMPTKAEPSASPPFLGSLSQQHKPLACSLPHHSLQSALKAM